MMESGKIRKVLIDSLDPRTYNIKELENSLSDEVSFEDAGIDSLDILAFYLAVEAEFDISIPELEYNTLDSILAVSRFVNSKARQYSGTG